MVQPVWCAIGVADGQGREHDHEVGFDGLPFVVVDGSGLWVVLGHAEAHLDAPQLVVGGCLSPRRVRQSTYLGRRRPTQQRDADAFQFPLPMGGWMDCGLGHR
jgi:hypothetical protein